jgi:DNA gyrase subunit B
MKPDKNQIESNLRLHVDRLAGLIGPRYLQKPKTIQATIGYIEGQWARMGYQSSHECYDAVGDQAKRATTAVSVGNKGAITRPSELLEAILIAGRKGLSISRYKGLGEMNAEQLWETTLDPDHRSLLRVEIDQADLADDIFTKLMGEVVEPRRDFIVENALNVANLDV